MTTTIVKQVSLQVSTVLKQLQLVYVWASLFLTSKLQSLLIA